MLRFRSLHFFHLLALVGLIALLLLVRLSFFNQPTGDDFWYTWVANKYGFWGAQKNWFVTINGRFSSSALMSINSLRWGRVFFFAIGPVLIIIGYCFAFFRIFKLLLLPNLSSWQAWMLALIVCSSMFYSFPGLYEGLFWMSAVVGYQLPLLLLLMLAPNLLLQSQKETKPLGTLFLLVIFIISGFHELVAIELVMLSAVMVAKGKVKENKVSYFWLSIFLVATVALTVQIASVGNREKAALAGSMRIIGTINLLMLSVKQYAYHLVKGIFLSPAVLASMFMIAILSAKDSGKHATGFRRPFPIKFSIVMLMLSTVPPVIVSQIEQYKAPMRVMNFTFVICFVWAIAVSAWFGNWWFVHQRQRGIVRITMPNRLKNAMVLLLFVFGFGVRGDNVYLPILDGSAADYHRAINRRIEACLQTNEGSVNLDCLSSQPVVLCPVDICDDPTLIAHMEKVFNKKIYIR